MTKLKEVAVESAKIQVTSITFTGNTITQTTFHEAQRPWNNCPRGSANDSWCS